MFNCYSNRANRVLLGMTIALVICTTNAVADLPILHVPSETADGGLTLESQIDRQSQLHNLLMSEMPAGVADAPVRISLTQRDRDDLAIPAVNGVEPLRIGVVKAVSGVDIVRGQAFRQGVVEEGADGSFVWALQLRSPGAQAIRVQFRNFSLPGNAEMYFVSTQGAVDGPYVDNGRNGNGNFWTRSLNGEEGTLMIRFTDAPTEADKRNISFVVSNLGHINGRPPSPQEQNHDSWPCSDNAACVVDANCVNAGPATPARDAIAKMEWIGGASIFTCSGGLIADTDGSSQIPLFLTANHCTSKSVSNMEFFFNYETSSCNGDCPDNRLSGGTPPAANAVGFTVLSSGRKGDYTLGQLNQSPPSGAVFLGWTNAVVANSNGDALHRISNPNFGPQAYSEHSIDTGAGTCRGWPRGERIYSADVTGATMGGSSGSPVVNASGEVVGQLSGCCGFNCGDECDTASNSTVDGALAFYYGNIAGILNPVGCTPSTEICDDGADNDCDGATDCDDSDCSGDSACNCTPSTEVCDDGADNDCDGATDCDDSDCSGDAACSCSLGQAGDSCTNNSDCCSNSCKGKPGGKTCK